MKQSRMPPETNKPTPFLEQEVGESVTHWLSLWKGGDDSAVDHVTALVYQDLRRLASYYLGSEASANTLQPTALVHEAYLRVVANRELDWKNRSHFIAITARTMRRILVDHARSRKAAKRDSAQFVPDNSRQTAPIDILAVNEALERFAASHPRKAQIVELRFFGGLEFAEIAETLDISLATVERDWKFARSWLQAKLSDSE